MNRTLCIQFGRRRYIKHRVNATNAANGIHNTQTLVTKSHASSDTSVLTELVISTSLNHCRKPNDQKSISTQNSLSTNSLAAKTTNPQTCAVAFANTNTNTTADATQTKTIEKKSFLSRSLVTSHEPLACSIDSDIHKSDDIFVVNDETNVFAVNEERRRISKLMFSVPCNPFEISYVSDGTDGTRPLTPKTPQTSPQTPESTLSETNEECPPSPTLTEIMYPSYATSLKYALSCDTVSEADINATKDSTEDPVTSLETSLSMKNQLQEKELEQPKQLKQPIPTTLPSFVLSIPSVFKPHLPTKKHKRCEISSLSSNDDGDDVSVNSRDNDVVDINETNTGVYMRKKIRSEWSSQQNIIPAQPTTPTTPITPKTPTTTSVSINSVEFVSQTTHLKYVSITTPLEYSVLTRMYSSFRISIQSKIRRQATFPLVDLFPTIDQYNQLVMIKKIRQMIYCHCNEYVVMTQSKPKQNFDNLQIRVLCSSCFFQQSVACVHSRHWVKTGAYNNECFDQELCAIYPDQQGMVFTNLSQTQTALLNLDKAEKKMELEVDVEFRWLWPLKEQELLLDTSDKSVEFFPWLSSEKAHNQFMECSQASLRKEIRQKLDDVSGAKNIQHQLVASALSLFRENTSTMESRFSKALVYGAFVEKLCSRKTDPDSIRMRLQLDALINTQKHIFISRGTSSSRTISMHWIEYQNHLKAYPKDPFLFVSTPDN